MMNQQPTPGLQRYFGGLVEQTFQVRLGLADPSLLDYLSDLLARFVHCDAIFRIRGAAGKRLEQVVQMISQTQAPLDEPSVPTEVTVRDIHRHVGDFTLFWVGIYPEGLRRLCGAKTADQMIDYRQQGKRSYLIASTIEPAAVKDDAATPPCEVLERLSYEYDLCAYGLREVRREWERREEDPELPSPIVLD